MGAARKIAIVVVALVVLLGTAAIVRTLVRQSRGPLSEDIKKTDRTATYAGSPSGDRNEIEGNGVVEPALPEHRLGADVPGRVTALYVKEGDQVEKGALLAEVENAVPRAQVARAEADLAVATASVSAVSHGMRSQDVNAFEAEATSAKARAALAESELARTQDLVAKGSLGAAELDQASKRSEAETAAARAATERSSGARSGGRYEDISIAQARVKGATAALEEARGALRRTQIFSPIAGEVLRLRLHVGEYHNPASDPLLYIGDVSHLRVRMDVDERDLDRVVRGATASVTCPAFGSRRFAGTLVDLSKRMGRRTVRVDDPKDRVDVKVLEATILLEGAPPLVPGMRVSAFVRATGAPAK